MRTDKLKKYLIPNIPYLFILWACLKLGTAYRLAAGADVAHKLMGLGQTIGPAFADFAPVILPFYCCFTNRLSSLCSCSLVTVAVYPRFLILKSLCASLC